MAEQAGGVMARFNWSDVYPGHRMVTLVLDEALAEEFLEQAADEGLLIAKDVVRGLPAIVVEPLDHADAPSAEKSRTAGRPSEDDEKKSHDLDKWNALGRKGEKTALEPETSPPTNVVILPVIQHERMDADPKNDTAPPPKAKVPAKPTRPSNPSLEPVEARSKRRSILDEKPPERDVPAAEPAVRYFAGKGPVRRGEVTEEDRAMVEAALKEGTVEVTKCPPGHARGDYYQLPSDWGTVSGNERQKTKRRELKKRREANHGNG